MRAVGVAGAVVLTLLAGGVAVADDAVPSRQEVEDARVAVRDMAQDVDSVRAQLVVANQRLQESSIAAAQAAEAYNGARWRAAEARREAATAQRRSEIAAADVQRQREAYGDALVTSYQLAPGLTALSAIVHSDGIETVIQRTATMHNAEEALDGKYDEFRASATLADVATDQAEQARDRAEQAEGDALEAKRAAQAAADAAASDAAAITEQKTALIAQLAELEQVSVRVAQRRQSALEERAAAAAAAAAQREQEARDREEQAQQQTQTQDGARDQGGGQQQARDPEPADPAPSAPSAPSAPATPATPATPPASASGARAAIAYARAQLGEPYVWGAAGPSSWDCSGLTMGAWRAGGKYLPHYSVAQYEQSTPISSSQLQPGDLVFWGSSSDPGSIYHVALYAGGGKIIHAPRTGRPVTEESMYYWIPPNFHARP